MPSIAVKNMFITITPAIVRRKCVVSSSPDKAHIINREFFIELLIIFPRYLFHFGIGIWRSEMIARVGVLIFGDLKREVRLLC